MEDLLSKEQMEKIEDFFSTLCEEIYRDNFDRGFYDEPLAIAENLVGASDNIRRYFEDMINVKSLALASGEISEAIEAIRKGKTCKTQVGFVFENQENFKQFFEQFYKDTLEDEISDAIIRLLDFAGRNEINIGAHIYLKLMYNLERGYKHGKNF